MPHDEKVGICFAAIVILVVSFISFIASFREYISIRFSNSSIQIFKYFNAMQLVFSFNQISARFDIDNTNFA